MCRLGNVADSGEFGTRNVSNNTVLDNGGVEIRSDGLGIAVISGNIVSGNFGKNIRLE